MKAAVWFGGKDIRIEDKPKPEIKDDEVLINVKAASICGADLHAYKGLSKRRKPPLIMGHEFSGEVTQVGKKVKKLSKGDRVAVEPIISCGRCKPCKQGKRNVCENRRLIGLHSSGAFAEYVAVPEIKCYKLPEKISFEEAALIEPLAVAVHAINITPIKKEDNIVIIGSGTIGLMVLQVARNINSGKIIVTGHRDYLLEEAKKLDANQVINTNENDPVKSIRSIYNGADVVFEAVGRQDTVQQALSMLTSGGCVTIIGMLEDKMELDMLNVTVKEIEIRGSYGYKSDDFKQALNLVSSGKIKVKPFITHVFQLKDIVKGFDALAGKKENVIKVVIKF